MNILVLSCGSRNKIVQHFKSAFTDGLVICADSSRYAPALYDGDYYEIIPKISDQRYIPTILNLCRSYKIRGLVSLIDPELKIIAQHLKEFEALGVMPMISSEEAIINCFDKAEFARTLEAIGIDCPATYDCMESLKYSLSVGNLHFPIMVKPACGSASVGLTKVENETECQILFEKYSGLIAQEWISFDEYGVDCYIDMLTGQLSDMFIKQKLKMRAGETDKAISRRNYVIRDSVLQFIERYPYRLAGAIDIDVFYNENRCLISEINPRFGGGYPHAYACGLDYPNLFKNNLEGLPNEKFADLSFEEGVVMMKYSEVMIQHL